MKLKPSNTHAKRGLAPDSAFSASTSSLSLHCPTLLRSLIALSCSVLFEARSGKGLPNSSTPKSAGVFCSGRRSHGLRPSEISLRFFLRIVAQVFDTIAKLRCGGFKFLLHLAQFVQLSLSIKFLLDVIDESRNLPTKRPAVRAACGRRSGPSTIRATTPTSSNSPKPKSNMDYALSSSFLCSMTSSFLASLPSVPSFRPCLKSCTAPPRSLPTLRNFWYRIPKRR